MCFKPLPETAFKDTERVEVGASQPAGLASAEALARVKGATAATLNDKYGILPQGDDLTVAPREAAGSEPRGYDVTLRLQAATFDALAGKEKQIASDLTEPIRKAVGDRSVTPKVALVKKKD
jgi:hypothetical protein